MIEKVAKSKYKDNTLIFVVEDDAQNGGDHVDAHRSIALLQARSCERGELVSRHYTTVSMIRTMVDVLGIEPAGLNDALAEPMADIFDADPEPWTYTAVVPAVLYSTQLPLPAPTLANRQQDSAGRLSASSRPFRTAEYWDRVMAGQDFEREDDLDTDRFNVALWTGLRGDGVAYPTIRHGKDMRRNRQQLIKQHTSPPPNQQ